MLHTTKNKTEVSRSDVEKLYIEYEKILYNVVLRWVWNDQDAMEIVQESFMKYYNKSRTTKIENPKAYVFRSALNMAQNKKRSKRLWNFVTLKHDDPFASNQSNEDSYIAAIDSRKVKKAVEILPAKLKRVVTLSDIGQMSYKEVSDVLNIPEGTVASRRNAALKKMHEYLGGGRNE